jgi:hypothetical protein
LGQLAAAAELESPADAQQPALSVVTRTARTAVPMALTLLVQLAGTREEPENAA